MSPRRLRQLDKTPVTELRGVGPKKADALALVGVESVLDLITYYPHRWIDRTRQARIADLRDGEQATVLAQVTSSSTRRARSGRAIAEVDVADGSASLHVTFFNQAWRARQLAPGTTALLFGKVERYRGRRQMANPVVDFLGDKTGRIIPIYPESDKAGITTWEVGPWIAEALDRAGEFVDPLPAQWRDRLDLVDRTWSFRQIHAPDSMEAKEAARRRLAFDELLRLQALLVMRKRAVERESKGVTHVIRPAPERDLLARFLSSLPFALTNAQRRALDSIVADLDGPHPMHRLLQGDVGAGKTVVAVGALLVAVQGGHQGALMAPTEVLAEQHFLALRDLLGELVLPDERTLTGERPLRFELLTGRTPAAARARLLEALASGDVDFVIGTHALLVEKVEFHSLGVVVIDEQHRFGVEQRAALRGKGDDPDVLVMTATPIPRTAAMTVYGDLDVTVLDELPPGRAPVTTVWAGASSEEQSAWSRLRREVAAGRQAYVVCPLVEGSEKIQARSATEEYEHLAAGPLDGLRMGLLHGQMAGSAKEQVMAEFRRGALQVLVSTTVVEVGVDVPNATVMVVENAERFGMAQLHQLRGRVGRAAHESWCYLLGEAATPEAERRLRALQSSTDGFFLAEEDLEIRGEGTILGTRQKGRNDLKLASLRRDRELVEIARQVAFDIVDSDPGLAGHEDLADELRVVVDEEEAEFLFKS